MEPPVDALRIVFDVCAKLSVDRDRLRDHVRLRFVPGAHWHDLMEAERVAREVVADAWGELALECDQALADVRELYLVQAARVLEAQNELQARGAASWIAGAVIYDQAAGLAWDILDEHGLLTEF